MDRKKILVVDDDAGTRLTIRKFLEFSRVAHFEVFEAQDGGACLKAVQDVGRFDLILLDIEMPDMDGFEVCRTIREVDSSVPIIFVTAHADVEHRVKGRSAGSDSFLAKPIREVPLLSVVKLFLNASRHR
ncbi:MAG: response regulator [Acidobacteria bacterium]|nr:response regulator [Acidobacteriota bacterium]